MMLRSGLGVSNVVLGPAGMAYDAITGGWKDISDFFSSGTISQPPNPAFGAPIAPQTESAMRSWTPDQQAEAYAQRGGQYTDDTNYFGSLLQGGSGVKADGSNAIPPAAAPKSDNTFMWVLAGVAGVLFLTTVVKR